MLRKLLIVGVCLASLPLLMAADDKEGKTKEFRSKKSQAKHTCGAACSVNFSKELGLSLDYLDSIGHRISDARKAPDPVELAMAAQALSVAEKVSGKKASITSAAVQTEALEIGKMRGISTELAALALVIPDAAIKADLEKQLVIAKKREDEDKAKTKSGETAKELIGTLTVINHTSHNLRITVGGRNVGTVPSGHTRHLHVHDHDWTSHFDAYCTQDGDMIREGNLTGHYHRATWHIDE